MLRIVRANMGDQIYEMLKSKILKGEIHSGSVLTIDEITGQIQNSSRTPVRDALNRLRGEGLLVTTDTGKLQVIKLTADQIAQICELRCALEVLGLRWGFVNLCKARMEKEIDTLMEIREGMKAGSIQNWDREDNDFHEMIISASNNEWLSRIYSQLRHLIDVTRHMFWRTERVKQTCEEHITIVTALISGDLESSIESLTRHIDNLKQYLLSRYSQSSVDEGKSEA